MKNTSSSSLPPLLHSFDTRPFSPLGSSLDRGLLLQPWTPYPPSATSHTLPPSLSQLTLMPPKPRKKPSKNKPKNDDDAPEGTVD